MKVGGDMLHPEATLCKGPEARTGGRVQDGWSRAYRDGTVGAWGREGWFEIGPRDH